MDIMATWTHSESSNLFDKDNTLETENGNMCSDKPMDLKQVICNQDDTLSDWDTSKLIKTKAFRIKDILGLDENEKLMSTSNDGNNFKIFNKSSTITSNAPSMLYILGKFMILKTSEFTIAL